MPAHYYVAKRSRIGRTTEPYRGREEFVSQCLRGVTSQTRRGVDWEAFPNKADAVAWLNNHPASENPDDDVLTPTLVQKPYHYQLLVSLAVLFLACVAFRVLQAVYNRHCVMNGWWDYIYVPWNMFMPHCQAYQRWLVSANDWFVYAVWGFLSSFSVYIYMPLYHKFNEWTVFESSSMPNLPE